MMPAIIIPRRRFDCGTLRESRDLALGYILYQAGQKVICSRDKSDADI